MTPRLTIVLGPTASGKTDYSIGLAERFSSPVISCDSRQIFREMTIGTAVPDEEQLSRVKHYFIHSHSITDHYTAGRYELEAMDLVTELFKTHDHLVMCGGSCLYIDAFCNGLDDFPEADLGLRAELTGQYSEKGLEPLCDRLLEIDPDSYWTIDISNPQRVIRALEVTLATGRRYSQWKTSPERKRPFEIEKTGIRRPRSVLYERIDRRVDGMIEAGLVEEVRSLSSQRDLPALNTVGYREMFGYLDGLYPLEEAVRLIKRNTRHYAKRQMTWWNRDNSIRWIDL